MRVILLSIVSILCITSAICAQKNIDFQSEKKHFRIVPFMLNGQEVSSFKIVFIVDGREIIPEKLNGLIFVPNEVDEAPDEKKSMRLTVDDSDFVFNNMAFRGYLDSDDVKSDYELHIDTIPLNINTKHVSRLTKKERRAFRIKTYKDVCAVYWWTASNLVVVNKPNLIVDPITTTEFR